MFKNYIIFFFLLCKFVLSNNHYVEEKENDIKYFIRNLVEYFNFANYTNLSQQNECEKELLKTIWNNNMSDYIEHLYFGSSLNKNDVNTYTSCIKYYDKPTKERYIYLTALIFENNSLYDVLSEPREEAGYITGLCFIKGCKKSDYKTILFNILNKIYNHKTETINNNETIINKPISKEDVEIYLSHNDEQKNIFITILEYIPFAIISIHIIFVLFNCIPICIINAFFIIFCCKKNNIKMIKSKSALNRLSNLGSSKKQVILNDRIPSIATVRSSNENIQKSLEILYNPEINLTSLSSYQKHSRKVNNIGLAYINGLKGIFMIFLLFGNVYMACYGGYIAEKSKKNFFKQIKDVLFFFFYLGIRFAPKMLLCAGGFSLFFKFMSFLDGKMDYELEIAKQKEEGNKDMNNSSTSSSKFFNKMKDKNKLPILSYKYLFKFYLRQMNKYIIYILFLCFFLFSFNNIVILLRSETPLWNFFNENIITPSKEIYYLLPLLLGFKSHLIPGLSNNDKINLLDYFYLPFQEIIFFLITSLIIFIGYRNNYKIDRFLKLIGILIFIYRIVFYCLNNLDDKDYFSFNAYGKFYNSMLYNYNFYIIGIHFGMINYTLHKGYIERDLEMNEKNYLLSTIKFLKTIQTNKRKKLSIISIISIIIIILISFFQQIIISFYDFYKIDDLSNYKNNKFAEAIMFFDSDVYVVLFYLMALCQYIKGDNRINNFLCHDFWILFNNFYFSYIILINPVILYILYTTDTKLVFNLSNCFLYTFICGTLVFSITIIIYVIFELPLKNLISFLMKTYENDAMKERLSTIENNPEQNLLDNVTVSLTDIIDDEEEEDNDETEKNNN